jgi:phosphohistidine phosphatase SixA
MGATLSADRHYVILVRHASRDFLSASDEAEQAMSGWNANLERVPPDFNTPGLPRTLAIAGRLADELGTVRVAGVWHGGHTVARQTAQAYQQVLGKRDRLRQPADGSCPIHCKEFLDPDQGSAASVAAALEEALAADVGPAGSAIVVVGHQPMLTLAARELTNKRLPGRTLPLAGSEAACLEMNGSGGATLLWMLTEKSDALLDNLKSKIESKYDVAKFFLGAFVVNTGFILSSEIWRVESPVAVGVVFAGMIFTLIALALTAATLLSYDRLMMPAEFWTGVFAEGSDRRRVRPRKWSVLRPPSQAHVVLFYEMIHVWSAFFLWALGFAFAAVASFLVALVHNSVYRALPTATRDEVSVPLIFLIAALALSALAIPLAGHYWPRRPELGFED